jgi:hypothetical protein
VDFLGHDALECLAEPESPSSRDLAGRALHRTGSTVSPTKIHSQNGISGSTTSSPGRSAWAAVSHQTAIAAATKQVPRLRADSLAVAPHFLAPARHERGKLRREIFVRRRSSHAEGPTENRIRLANWPRVDPLTRKIRLGLQRAKKRDGEFLGVPLQVLR